MAQLASIFHVAMEGILFPFDLLGPFWGLTLLSFLSGVGMLWVVGKTTPQKLVTSARNQMDAAVYEIRLFLDSPKRVGISLGRLMLNSVLYVVYMLPAFVILALPMGLMYLHLETRHGLASVPLHEPFVATIELAQGVDGRSVEVTGQEGLRTVTDPLYVASRQALFVRCVADAPGTLHLLVTTQGHTETKEVVTDPNATVMAPDRESGLNAWLGYGPEAALDGPITAIRVPHGPKDTSYLGISMPWWLWWLIWMMIAAFGLRKQLGVVL